MDAVTYALKNVSFHIPREILNLAFMRTEEYGFRATSLESNMHNLVVRPRVLIDCNLVGGVQLIIPLVKCIPLRNDLDGTVLEIPKKLTNGRLIMSCDSIVSGGSNVLNAHNVTSVGNSMSIMSKNSDAIPVIHSSSISLVGENRIFIKYQEVNITDMYLKVNVENEVNMDNLSPKSYIAFAELVRHAIKAYIYTETVVNLDKGRIYQGHDLSIVKDIIDSYSEANVEYQEYLSLVFEKVLFMSDDAKMDNFVTSLFPNT